jgi:acetamidase/formamidase
MRVTVRLTILKEHSHITHPHFSTTINSQSENYYATTGVGPSMLDATKDAVRGMIATLTAQHGLSAVESYMLCSVAGDLRLHEVVSVFPSRSMACAEVLYVQVDMPNYVVSCLGLIALMRALIMTQVGMMIPQSIFGHS